MLNSAHSGGVLWLAIQNVGTLARARTKNYFSPDARPEYRQHPLLENEDDLQSIETLLPKWGIPKEENARLTVLGGGVSNVVVKVVSQSKGAFVVKRSLPKLRVEEDWFADRRRIMREAACLRVIGDYVGQNFAPKVLLEDAQNFACLLECAPEGTVTWKKDLLENKVDPRVTEEVSSFLSNFHGRTRTSEKVREEFADQSNFIQLRINPYLVRVSERHPDLKMQLDEMITGLLSKKLCLVHGDFSPKNILLLPGGKIWMIDCEVAHWGNPAFDVAFCTNHLLLKAIHLSSLRHLKEADRFWGDYWQESGWSHQEPFTTRVLGGLMLARVDGKSPAEYLSEGDRNLVRGLSRSLVADRVEDFEQVTAAIEKRIQGDT
ncbi:MAG TPA: aminoglycoside phosphotransferase family protein [Nitrososphaerales archaeon]|nr:aminoglycoside phosphotransferase family protein [Nitrososphaerales archaeon]